jgi:hypothetical protein
MKAWQTKDDKDWLQWALWVRSKWQRLATEISVTAWQVKDDKDWLQRCLLKHKRSKIKKDWLQQCSAIQKGVCWPDMMTATKHPVRCSKCNRQILQSECYFCSPVAAYWIHLYISPGVWFLPLRMSDMEVYGLLSCSLVLWRTPTTTVRFLAIYTSAFKRDEAVILETLIPTHQNII